MRASNLPSGGQRTSEVGLVYVEICSGSATSTTSFPIQKYSAVRIRSVASALAVSVDGLLTCTLSMGEIITINVGRGSQAQPIEDFVTLSISGGNAFIQVGQELERI